jgi:hypothetical protein
MYVCTSYMDYKNTQTLGKEEDKELLIDRSTQRFQRSWATPRSAMQYIAEAERVSEIMGTLALPCKTSPRLKGSEIMAGPRLALP